MNDSYDTSFEQLSEFVTDAMTTKRIPGVAVGILHQGKTYTTGFGVTNVNHPLPVTDETLFQIGSITKTFTGTAIMRLVEMGKLDLDAMVRTYVPDFKLADEKAASQATIRHIFTHTGGWVGDFFDDTGVGDDASAKYVANMTDLEQLAPIGTVYSYNNSGFCLAGYIIEQVTGQSYQTALKELVLESLGLENCYFDPGDVITYRFAVGHQLQDQEAQVARPWPLPRAVYPAGGIVCHVKDLLHYAQFHLGNGVTEDETRLLTPESMSQMQSPHVTIRGTESVGLTWFIENVNGTRLLLHSGGTIGQVSLLTLVPEHDFAIAIFTNADEGGSLTQDVSRWALREYLELEITDPTPVESSVEELAPYVGRYARPFSEIELGILGGKLVAQLTYKQGFPDKDSPLPPPPPPMSLALYEPDHLLVLDGPYKDSRGDIVRKPDGSIGWLRVGRIHKKVEE
ncbi:MAG: beta-lactamase family protein [Chloroflexi bacterium]|nr:beta-lactamase family protein [Chloroflexota bacterium]